MKLIHGVTVKPLKVIADERGYLMEMLRADDPFFQSFGQVYCSVAYPGVVKGWHLHRNMTLSYACVYGRIKLAVYDDREGSSTRKELMEIFLGPDDYSLVVIPPGLWNGFKGMAPDYSIVADCIDIPHAEADSERIDPHHNHIPYDWSVKER